MLKDNNKGNYAIVTLLAYTGIRILEVFSTKMSDFNLQTGECMISSEKGDKQ